MYQQVECTHPPSSCNLPNLPPPTPPPIPSTHTTPHPPQHKHLHTHSHPHRTLARALSHSSAHSNTSAYTFENTHSHMHPHVHTHTCAHTCTCPELHPLHIAGDPDPAGVRVTAVRKALKFTKVEAIFWDVRDVLSPDIIAACIHEHSLSLWNDALLTPM